MMSLALAPESVLQKTLLGSEEIATRKNGLAARLRSLLILIDGKLSVEQLLTRGQALGLSQDHLLALVNTGMCELAGPPPAPVPQVEPSRPAVKRSVAVARMYLLDQMDRMLGTQSEPVRAAIREARTHHEVLQVLELSLEVVRELGGEARAALIRQKVTELLPD
jgi:hypothetical protein